MTGYALWVLLLAALLYYPTSRLVWVLSVRRLERRQKRKLTESEIAGQRRRAWVIAAPLCLVFSALFNFATLNGT